MTTVADLGIPGVQIALGSQAGLSIEMGPVNAKVRTRLPKVASAIASLYGSNRLAGPGAFVDFDVAIRRPAGLRALLRPQVTFELEGDFPFEPMPGDQGFPMLEWGLNWCMYSVCHQYLTLHAAVLERGGRALIMPAPSGSGKSTLCAGLLFHGWRLLSDELTLICPREGNLVPMPRPVSVKNASIDVLAKLIPQLRYGSQVAETNKGVVAHFAAPTEAVRLASQRALPAWVVLPRYVKDMPATLLPMPRARAFMSLIENAFNYDVFGLEGFNLLGSVIDRSQCFSFQYGHLPEAIELFSRLADGTLSSTG